MAIQFDLFGGAEFVGSIQERIEHLLENHPGARDSYHELILRYWLNYDGLGAILATQDQRAAFRCWFLERATSTKTIQNRAMEVQRRRPELDSSPQVRQSRDAQASAGPVGSR